jgi:hypothetical protein
MSRIAKKIVDIREIAPAVGHILFLPATYNTRKIIAV